MELAYASSRENISKTPPAMYCLQLTYFGCQATVCRVGCQGVVHGTTTTMVLSACILWLWASVYSEAATGELCRKIHHPRVLLLDCPLEYKKGENQTNVELSREEDWCARLVSRLV